VNARDFAFLMAICMIWGMANVLTRWIVADVPPFFFAMARFSLLSLALSPFLRPAPKQIGLMFVIATCMGSLNFAMLFLALKNANAGSVALAGQLSLPFTTLLSMAFLSERVGWRRALGMALAFAGVVVIAYDPKSFQLSLGVGLSAVAALLGSIGSVAMKRMAPITMFQLQAWVAVLSWPVLMAMTLAFEHRQLESAYHLGWPFVLALLFTVFGVSLIGHGGFYTLVKRYDMTLLTPLTLTTPVWTMGLGAAFLNEAVTPKLAIGAALALGGALMIAVRRPRLSLPEPVMFWRRWGA
jgi:O-acetylserine/cysteine efflux transporter